MKRKCVYCNQIIDSEPIAVDKSFKCPSCGFPNAAANTTQEENLKKLIPKTDDPKAALIEKSAKEKRFQFYAKWNPISHIFFAAAILNHYFFYRIVNLVYHDPKDSAKIYQLTSDILLPIFEILIYTALTIFIISRIKLAGWKFLFYLGETPNIRFKQIRPYIVAITVIILFELVYYFVRKFVSHPLGG